MLLSPDDVQERGLGFLNVNIGRKSEERLLNDFRHHYGSSPLDIACCWHDLCNLDEDSEFALQSKEKSEKGFKMFMAAQYFLWNTPSNSEDFASRWGVCADYVRGKRLWKWVDRIASLCSKKIQWEDCEEIMAMTADGVDCHTWEIQHPEFPVDRSAMSHKFRKCGARYLIGLSVHRSKCVAIEGPFKGGKNEVEIFRESGLMKLMQDKEKVCIADRGFRSKLVSEQKVFSLPDYMDSEVLHNYKSRARLRHETFNRRLKHFDILSHTFRWSWDKHGRAFRAVAVMVQYQMDNGSPLFSV